MALSRFVAALAVCVSTLGAPAWADEVQEINRQFRSGDLGGALDRADRYLAQNPRDAQARFLKGLILADQGRRDEAVDVFTRLTEDYPELPEPYNNLAVLYAAQSRYDAAMNALETAIRAHPNYATAHENLGDLHARMASLAYEKALALDGTNTAVQAKRARIEAMLGGAAASVPGSSQAVAPAEAGAGAPDQEAAAAIEAAIAAWASAWSNQDVAAYFAAYASDFSPAGMSRAQWEAQRRSRIAAARSIEVQISDLEIEQQGDAARANFRQSYRSDRLSTTVSKTLGLARTDGRWRIVDEISR